MRVAPPDSAIILPSIVPSPTTIAMNPSTPPTPSWNALTTPPSGIPAAAPRPRDTAISATKGCSLNRAMSTISATTAPSAKSSSRVFWLMPRGKRARHEVGDDRVAASP